MNKTGRAHGLDFTLAPNVAVKSAIFFLDAKCGLGDNLALLGQVAQLVEQRTENPRVGGSIPPLATSYPKPTLLVGFVISGEVP